MGSSKFVLVSVVLVGLVAVSSCRSLSGGLSEKKTYSSAPQYGGSPPPAYGSGVNDGTTPTPSDDGSTTPSTPTGFPQIGKQGFTGSCDYWKKHPDMIIAAVGSLGDLGKTFGAACRLILGKEPGNLHDALSNTRTDGLGALLREGAAAYLNSIVNAKFPFTVQQVKDGILVAVTSSDGAASAQAAIFKKANEHHY